MTTQQMSDAEPAGQPAASWTGVAYEALIAFTRARQIEKAYTQTAKPGYGARGCAPAALPAALPPLASRSLVVLAVGQGVLRPGAAAATGRPALSGVKTTSQTDTAKSMFAGVDIAAHRG